MPSTHLTQRQRQVLKYIMNGATSREVAKHLNLSVQTVEVHRFNLMKKLNVRNMAQLITRALKMGLIVWEDGRWKQGHIKPPPPRRRSKRVNSTAAFTSTGR